MALELQLNYQDSIPLEVEGVTPDQTLGKSLGEIERMEVCCGNQKGALADFFRVRGSAEDGAIHWQGDLSGVHWIGAGMTRGAMRIDGPAGRHVGSRMTGGSIEVHGNVSDWVGAEMLGGRIQIHGNAGHLAGAGYRGSARGMTGGTLLIDGDAGNEVGHAMRRGFLAVGGNIGDLAGMNMLAGSIFVFGQVGIRHGAGMRRGTIALLGASEFEPLPTFRPAFRGRLEILRLIERFLTRHYFPMPVPLSDQTISLFNGDLLEGGRGEILLPAD
jgi:formylmethanofuran dehydrogenase subunit C